MGNQMQSDPSLVVLVPGGGGGLGQTVVQHFVTIGAQVHVPFLPNEDLAPLQTACAPLAGSLHTHAVDDLASPQAVQTLFDEIPSPDVLLHLAGGFAMGPVEDTDAEIWNRMIQMNATSLFHVAKAAFAEMKKKGWGRIVTVSALPALNRGAANMSAYAASKAAVLNLTETLAREGAPFQITANAILPSIMDTPGNRAAMPDADRSTWIQPQEVAEILAFLASPSSGAITGAALPLTRTPG